MIDEIKEIYVELKKEFKELVDEITDKNLEADQSSGSAGVYFRGYDTDDVDIGVGHAVVRKELIQDEDKAYADAKQELLKGLKEGDEEAWERVINNEKIRNKLTEFLEGML